MHTDLLFTLRHHFGTVSQQTETSGVVAIRNVTALKNLAAIAERFNHTLTAVTGADSYPRLVRVIEREVGL